MCRVYREGKQDAYLRLCARTPQRGQKVYLKGMDAEEMLRRFGCRKTRESLEAGNRAREQQR